MGIIRKKRCTHDCRRLCLRLDLHDECWSKNLSKHYFICEEMAREIANGWMKPKIPDGKPTRYGWIVRRPRNFRLGVNTDIGAFTYIQAEYGVIIEENVKIGSHCSIYSVSTINDKKGPVLLKKNCRVGSHSIIMPGVTIGENSIVGAFSYITHDVPANTIIYPKTEYRRREIGYLRDLSVV